MADNNQPNQQSQGLLQLLSNLIGKFAFGQQALGQAANGGGSAPPPQGQGAPAGAPAPQDPSYVQGAVNEYMRQQGLRKQQQQLNQQKQQLQQQKTKPPSGGGAPQAQTDTSAPYMNLFHSLVGNLT